MELLKRIVEFLGVAHSVVLEVISNGNKSRYVIPFSEWKQIKSWYYDDEFKEDYLLTLDDAVDSYTMVRLNKATSEIRVWEISRMAVLTKNAGYIFKSFVPRIIRFFTAFFIAVLMWPVLIAVSFLQKTDLTVSALAMGTRITTLIFTIFLLFNLLYVIFKAVDVFLHKYRAFVVEEEAFLTDTVAFNLLVLIVFFSLGGDKLVGYAEYLWNYVADKM